MSKWIWLIALLVAAASVCAAGVDPAAQQLLVAAKQQASLSYNQKSPFRLDVNFVAQINDPARGHLTLKWAAKDRWWRKVTMGGFEQIDIRSGDELYTTRNVSFTPIRIRELISLLQFGEGWETLNAMKQRQRTENGVDIACLKVEYKDSKAHAHEICINPATHEILSDHWHASPEQMRRERYSDYINFEGHRFPRQLELLASGSNIISANLETLATAPFDQSLLVPPKGAIENRQCDDMKLAVAIKTPDPIYPESAARNPMSEGSATVSVTVLNDGSVGDIELIASAGGAIDQSVLQAVRNWRFNPAMCGTEPVISDVEVVVSFRLR